MDEMIFQVFVLISLILINGAFSMTEIAVVSSRRVRLAKAADDGNVGAATALRLQLNPENFLSTVQIGITLVGVLSGAIGGALLSDEAAAVVARVPILEPYAPTIGFGIIIVIITYFSLVIGELVPKSIALNYPETIASFFSRPLNFISRLTAPVVWLLSSSTSLVLKLLRLTRGSDVAITEEEIRAHIAHGTELGILEETEQELIESVIRLDDQRITAVMTSRVKIDRLDLDDSETENRRKLIETKFSRLPICRNGLDNVLGVVKSRDLLSHVLAGGGFDLEKVARDPVFVPETMTALELLELFKESGSSMALVIDEFGSVVGLVTLNDILEEIVGDLPASGVFTPSIIVRDDGSVLLDGQLSVVDFLEALDLKDLPADDRDSYHTLAGFILSRLERVPKEGDNFEWENRRFEVVDMDGRRVDKVLVSAIEKS